MYKEIFWYWECFNDVAIKTVRFAENTHSGTSSNCSQLALHRILMAVVDVRRGLGGRWTTTITRCVWQQLLLPQGMITTTNWRQIESTVGRLSISSKLRLCMCDRFSSRRSPMFNIPAMCYLLSGDFRQFGKCDWNQTYPNVLSWPITNKNDVNKEVMLVIRNSILYT